MSGTEGSQKAIQTTFNVEEEWKLFKEKFNRQYGSEEEEKRRFAIFSKKLGEIAEHNTKYASGEVSWGMGINQFTDKESHEMNVYCGVKK